MGVEGTPVPLPLKVLEPKSFLFFSLGVEGTPVPRPLTVLESTSFFLLSLRAKGTPVPRPLTILELTSFFLVSPRAEGTRRQGTLGPTVGQVTFTLRQCREVESIILSIWYRTQGSLPSLADVTQVPDNDRKELMSVTNTSRGPGRDISFLVL